MGRSRTRSKPLSGWAALGWTLACVYLPCCIGFFSDCEHCRAVWLRLWPVVPGILPVEYIRSWMGSPGWSDISRIVAAGGVTLQFIIIVWFLGRRSRIWMIIVGVLAAALSGFAAFAVYGAVRA